MLFTLLFDHRDQLIAAAPAVDVHQFGADYWRDVYLQPLTPGLRPRVATIEILDQQLANKLNSLALGDQHLAECQAEIDRLVQTTSASHASETPHQHQSPKAA